MCTGFQWYKKIFVPPRRFVLFLSFFILLQHRFLFSFLPLPRRGLVTFGPLPPCLLSSLQNGITIHLASSHSNHNYTLSEQNLGLSHSKVLVHVAGARPLDCQLP
jgi:hypothetical protein